MQMLTYRSVVLLGVLVASLGGIVSFYTEYILLIKPCFSCYILRYGYLLLIGLQLVSIKVKKLIIVSFFLTIPVIIISIYGVMGYSNYVTNPCIGACPYGWDTEVSFRLFSLSLIGGILEFFLMLRASKLVYGKPCGC